MKKADERLRLRQSQFLADQRPCMESVPVLGASLMPKKTVDRALDTEDFHREQSVSPPNVVVGSSR